MRLQRQSLLIIRVYTDILVLLISFFFAALMSQHPFKIHASQSLLVISLIFIFLFSSNATSLYDEFRSRNFSFELVSILKNVLIQSLAAIVVLFFLKDNSLSRSFVVVYSIGLCILLGLEKYAFRIGLDILRKRGRNTRSVLIIGAGTVGRQFYDSIKGNPHFGYKLLGFLDDEKKPYLNGQYLGPISSLETIYEKHRIDDIIIALPNYATEKIDSVIKICEGYTSRIKIIPDYFKYVSNKYDVSMFGKFPVVSMREDNINQIHWRLAKRFVDFMLTLIAFLLFFSWLWPVIIILQKLLNPGPVFYKAVRWGRNGQEFTCYKFRSMIPESKNVNGKGEHNHTSKSDARITKFGRFLRKTNLDELPQFWNVLKGEMSLVGPRPHDVQENIEIKDKIRSYMWRHIAKPGITGWAQIHGLRGGTSDIELMRKRTEYDIWYIENWSVWLDIQILTLTIWRTLKGDPSAY